MSLNRRQFVVLTAAVAAGCKREADKSSPTTAPSGQIVDAGPASDFPPEQVSAAFRDQGFFVIHRDKKLFALSAICTHKGCKVRVAPDQSFICKCHGSTFDRSGKVTKGPATRDLPHLKVALNAQSHLLVDGA